MKSHKLFIKKINFFVLIFIILIFNEVFSQKKYFGGLGFFSTGYQSVDVYNLNTKLRFYGFPELDKNYVAVGGGGFGIVNNFVLGGEGFGLVSPEKSNKDYNISLVGGYGLFDLGYIVYSNKRLTIFPLIGFGGGGIDVTIKEKKLVNFDDVLSNPKRGSKLSVEGLMLNFGLNLFYHLDLSETGLNFGGIMVGLNMGYTQFLQMGNWSLFETEISNGPKIGISGFYIKFTIGGGGIVGKEETIR